MADLDAAMVDLDAEALRLLVEVRDELKNQALLPVLQRKLNAFIREAPSAAAAPPGANLAAIGSRFLDRLEKVLHDDRQWRYLNR